MSRFKKILSEVLYSITKREEKYFLDGKYVRWGLIEREINVAHNEQVAHELASINEKIRDSLIKTKSVLEYCEPHLGQMWAAKIAGMLLGCDFRDAKDHLKIFFEYCEEKGIE